MTERHLSHDEIVELLPWFANGTLGESEHNRVKEAVESSPGLQAELNQIRALQNTVADTECSVPAVAPGLNRVLERIEQDRLAAGLPTRGPRVETQRRPVNWIKRFFESSVGSALRPYTMGGAVAVCLTLVIVMLVPGEDVPPENGYAVLSSNVEDSNLKLKITLAPSVLPAEGEALIQAELQRDQLSFESQLYEGEPTIVLVVPDDLIDGQSRVESIADIRSRLTSVSQIVNVQLVP